MKKLLTAVILLALCSNASAYTADELLTSLESGDSSYQKLTAMSYIAGWYRGYQTSDIHMKVINGESTKSVICFPDGTTVIILSKVFIKYVNDNPQELHEDAGVVLGTALAKAYFCRR